ncbi:MAG: S8 family serine peptidase [Pirellulales bacterium]
MKRKNSTLRSSAKSFRQLIVESLETRCLMAADVATNDWLDVKNGPLAKTGQQTIESLQGFRQWQDSPASDVPNALFPMPANSLAQFQDNSVVMEIIASDYSTALPWLKANGVQVDATDANYSVITGKVPLLNLETIARSPHVASMRIVEQPMTTTDFSNVSDGPSTDVGSVQSQADLGQNAPAARTQFSANGAGIKIGVLSDSVSMLAGGLADSQASGNLGAVQVIQDGPAGSTDEGRAMLELIKDIAPNSPLAFATAFVGGQTGYASNIDALRTAGSKVIVDDVSYFAEPMFQPGVIDLAVKRAVDANIPYFGSAGNSSTNGFEVPVTGAWAVGGLYDFKAGAGVDTTLRITIDRNATFGFQWDDPYNGIAAPGKVDTDLDLLFFNTSGGSIGTLQTNNIATGAPSEVFSIGPGTFDLSIKLAAGPKPTRMKLIAFRGNMTTEYVASQSSTSGHHAGPWTIGVGAVPFYEAPAFSATLPIVTESFTSTGPSTYIYDGVTQYRKLARQVVYNNPFISGIDNSNTSFFGSDISQDTDTFPNFAGTSAAAPNVAAVAALMKQKFPTARVNQIAQSLAETARPVNGAADAVWNNRGGYGLIDAQAAMVDLQTNLAGGQVIDNGDVGYAAPANWAKSTELVVTGDITVAPEACDGYQS